jgi:hypothetical protein
MLGHPRDRKEQEGVTHAGGFIYLVLDSQTLLSQKLVDPRPRTIPRTYPIYLRFKDDEPTESERRRRAFERAISCIAFSFCFPNSFSLTTHL